MNVLPVALAAWVLIGVQAGAADFFGLRFGAAEFKPDLVLPLAVFIALAAAPAPALWTCLVLGLAADMMADHPLSDGHPPLVILGPNALAYLLAGLLVLQVRSMMIKRNPLTLAALSAVAALVTGIVVVAALSIRRVYDAPLLWDTWIELVGRIGSAPHTGLAGLFLAWPLIRLSPYFGLGLGPRNLPRRAYERR